MSGPHLLMSLDFSTLPYYLAAGLCLGAIYALVALGYSMVYGIIKLINFAHGEFYMAGAYAGLGIYMLLPAWMPLLLAAVVTLLVSGLAGAGVAAATEYVAYRPIRSAGRLSALLTAIGVSLLLQNVATFIDGGKSLTFHGPLREMATLSVMGIETIKFAYIPVSCALTLLLWYVVKYTRLGKAMRATSQDLDAAVLMGINTDSVIRRTFILGGFLAGVAGTLVGVLRVVEPMMGFMPGLNAFVAAVVGGIGSIQGAFVGGYVIGVVRHVALWGGVPSEYADVATLLVLIVMLVFRPQGIFGRPDIEKV